MSLPLNQSKNIYVNHMFLQDFCVLFLKPEQIINLWKYSLNVNRSHSQGELKNNQYFVNFNFIIPVYMQKISVFRGLFMQFPILLLDRMNVLFILQHYF